MVGASIILNVSSNARPKIRENNQTLATATRAEFVAFEQSFSGTKKLA